MTASGHTTHESVTTSCERWSLLIGLAGITLAITMLLPRAASAAPLAHQGILASEVYVTSRQLAPGSYTFRIRNATAGSPMLHIYRGNGPSFTPIGQAGTTGQVTFTVSTTTSYQMMIRGTTATVGKVDLQQGTTTIATQVSFGGTTISVPTTLTGSVTFETALVKGGATDTLLYGLDANNGVIWGDNDGGVGMASRFVSPSSTGRPRSIVVAAVNSAARGIANFYINPTGTDSDGDGLGNALEDELLTCKNPTCSNAQHGRDTDRDGLTDMMEIFGVDSATFPQLLPKWGANPRHKDVFVEMDWSPEFSSNPFSSSDASAADAFYNVASAAEVANPDGQPGIRLHMDNGIANPDPASTLFGGWGGSNRSNDVDYRTAPNNPANFDPIRSGIFHYGLFTAAGTGQGGVNDFNFTWAGNTTTKNMHVFAHELGHNLGLNHWGHSSWGEVNCKPHYKSVMNYAYASEPFSKGRYGGILLNASSAQEDGLFTSTNPATFLSASPFFFTTKASLIDWNRDGLFQLPSQPMRAPVVWAPGIYCDGFGQGAQVVNWNDPPMFPAQPPSVFKAFGNLYIFYADQYGNINYQASAVGGADANGSCGPGNCDSWSEPFFVPTPRIARVVSAIPWNGGVLLVFQEGSAFYSKYATGADVNGELTGWSSDTFINNSYSGPDLSIMQVDPARFGGASEAVGLFWSDGTYYYQAMKTSLAGPWINGTWVQDVANNFLTGQITPTVASFPNQGVYNHSAIGTSCATFTDMNSQVRFYCYDKPSNKWREHTSTMFFSTGVPTSTAKTALTYHVIRNASGTPRSADATFGQWMLIVNPSDWRPVMYLGNGSGNLAPESRYFQIAGPISHQWAYTVAGAGLTLYEDETISAPKAAGFWQGRSYGTDLPITNLILFPFADGTMNNAVVLKDGNDFQVMERGICMSIKKNTTTCGTAGVWGY